MAKHHKRITDTKILKPFYQQYKDKKITLEKFAKSIHLGTRQARRNFKKFVETGEITVTRGFGSKNPYKNEDDFIKIFEMDYNGLSASRLKSEFEYKDRKAYRHYNILSHLCKHYDCVVSNDGKTCSFTTLLICNCIKTNVVSIVINIDLIEKKITSKDISKVPKKELPIDGSDKEEYHSFVMYFIKLMFDTYFKKIKMREMLDRLNEDERIEVLRKYIDSILDKQHEEELCALILNIKETLPFHTNYKKKSTK